MRRVKLTHLRSSARLLVPSPAKQVNQRLKGCLGQVSSGGSLEAGEQTGLLLVLSLRPFTLFA